MKVQHRRNEQLTIGPREVRLRDEGRDEAVDAHPAELGTGVRRVVELGARRLDLGQHGDKAVEHDRATNARPRRIVDRRTMADLAHRFGDVGSHEHQPVFVGMAEAEAGIGFAEAAHALHRIVHRLLDLADGRDQMAEGLIAKRQHQRFLVLEVEVERRRGNADPVGDAADRGRVVALLEEQLLGRVEDLLAAGMALAPALAAARSY